MTPAPENHRDHGEAPMNDAPAAARDALMDVLERALPPLYTDLSGLRSIADAILVSGLVVPASVVAAARRDALEEAAALIDRGYLDASVRMDPKRDHSVSDWFRRQQAAAIRALIPGEPK